MEQLVQVEWAVMVRLVAPEQLATESRPAAESVEMVAVAQAAGAFRR